MAACMGQSDGRPVSMETTSSRDKNANKLTIYLIISSDGERQLETLQQRTTLGCPLRDSLCNTLENQFDSYDIIEPDHLNWDASAETLKGQTLKLHKRRVPSVAEHAMPNCYTYDPRERNNLVETSARDNGNDNRTPMSSSMNISVLNDSRRGPIQSNIHKQGQKRVSKQPPHHQHHHYHQHHIHHGSVSHNKQRDNSVQHTPLLNHNGTDAIPVTDKFSSLIRGPSCSASHGDTHDSSGTAHGEGVRLQGNKGCVLRPSRSELKSRSSESGARSSSDSPVISPARPCSDVSIEAQNTSADRRQSNTKLTLEAALKQLNRTPPPGWLGRVSQKDLTSLISPYLHKDGHYVIWVPNECEELTGKLVMTVTHQRNLLHYNIRTRLMTNRLQYYIFKEVFHTPDLRELVQFYSNHELHGSSTDDKTQYMPTKHPQLRTPLCFDNVVL